MASWGESRPGDAVLRLSPQSSPRPLSAAELVAQRARMALLWRRVKHAFVAAVQRRVAQARSRLNSLRRGVLGLASQGAVVIAAPAPEHGGDTVHVTRWATPLAHVRVWGG